MTSVRAWLKSRESSASSSQDGGGDLSHLSALYADLAVRKSSERAAFEAGVEWWRRLLGEMCLAGISTSISHGGTSIGAGRAGTERLVLTVDQNLLDALTLDEIGRPLGIGTAVMEMSSIGCMYRPQTFLGSSNAISGPSQRQRSISLRALSLAATPLVWAMSQLSVSLGLNEHESNVSEEDWRKAQGEWVVWDNVEALSKAVVDLHNSRSCFNPLDSIYSTASFRRVLVLPALQGMTTSATPSVTSSITDRDLQILIKHLTRDKDEAVADGGVIKFKRSSDRDSSVITIEAHEREIVKVRETRDQLEAQVNDIEERITERQKRITASLSNKSKNQALSYLRSRKALEALRDKRVGALETLNGVLLKIEQAASDVEVMKAYEASTASLKNLLKDERLQPDRIDASMEAMQENMANAEEVRQAIEIGQDGVRAASGFTEAEQDEIDKELAALQQEVQHEKASADAAQKVEQLPSPPQDHAAGSEHVMQSRNEEHKEDVVNADKEAITA